ncbi:hypothetical protein [Psychrobacillus sp. OK032]|uniref:hypothetical protein n=1 Tax=Psychrobacillus sp. OK032 TaxID=1884358 RepID=UPI0008D4665D|nr:hypothetical protein [Psychrobacillus sp. OK032]SER56369.1 hypothetical protein SAMN05518872_101183 [Psychrobacillus sp. OK032]
MYSMLVFVHVVSSLFLGTYLVLPIIINAISSRSSTELKPVLKILLSFTRAGHYALILLVISGGSMVISYTSYPSILWVILSILLLIAIGGLIGLINKNIRQILLAEDPKKKLADNISTLKWYGWLNTLLVITTLFIMTNRGLFV